jgi:hypothetical protein
VLINGCVCCVFVHTKVGMVVMYYVGTRYEFCKMYSVRVST